MKFSNYFLFIFTLDNQGTDIDIKSTSSVLPLVPPKTEGIIKGMFCHILLFKCDWTELYVIMMSIILSQQ